MTNYFYEIYNVFKQILNRDFYHLERGVDFYFILFYLLLLLDNVSTI